MKTVFTLALLLFSLSKVYSDNGSVDNKIATVQFEEGYPEDAIPYLVIDYLDKNFKEFLVMVSKRQDDGTLFVKIKCNYKKANAYNKDLIFDATQIPILVR